ncbi:MAG TPA: glycosyltransferase family 39 protein [Candidatus Limnocylindrales bacterium]
MRTPMLLYAVALGVRLLLTALYPDPAYPDSYYYVDVARALQATGRLEVDFVWIFGEVGGRIPLVPVLPVASNAHWLPLSSFLQVPFIAAFGATAWASALPMILIGSLSAPLTWLIAREAGARREIQIGASLLAAIPAAGAVFMPQPENFAILQPLVAATVWLTARGLKGHTRSYVLAGFLVGLASLARNDGFILGLAVALVFVWDRARALRSRGVVAPRIPLAAAIGCFAMYLVVMGPWYVRQLAVFGSLSPTTSGGSALWIRTIDEWNSITANPSLGSFLAQGIGPIVSSRVGGLVSAVGQFAVIICSVLLVPFVVAGAWLRRRSVDFGPWFVYVVLVFLGAMLLYPLHVPGGAFIHSAVGLEPHAYILALEGVVAGVAAVARRRPAWNEATAGPIFVGAIVALTIATAALYAIPVQRSWADSRAPRLALAAQLDRLGVAADDRLLTIDAAGFKYFTGRGGVVTPDDPIDTIEAVARAYRTRWLVLERDQAARALAPVLKGESRPAWIGAPVFSVPAADGGPPRLALYPVCTDAADSRCLAVASGSTP